jgi:predicted O-methyltransferase YrrM
MPGVETAYAGAIVSAVKPRVLLIIGEHRGILTDYLAQQAPDDCLIFTIDLPQSMYSMAGVTQVDRINQSYIRHSDDRIGEVWRTSSKPHKERIFGFLGDSTHDHSKWLFETLRGRCDLVVVDGNHERQSVVSDLVNAWDVLTPHGVVLLDDFDKPPRLKGVEYAVQEARQLFAEFPYLYKVSWARPAEPGKPEDPDNVNSNLALLIKSSDPSLLARRDDMRTRLQGKARKMEGI